MGSKAEEKIFVDYCQDSKGYRLLDPINHNRSRDVIFLEEFKAKGKEGTVENYPQILEEAEQESN